MSSLVSHLEVCTSLQVSGSYSSASGSMITFFGFMLLTRTSPSMLSPYSIRTSRKPREPIIPSANMSERFQSSWLLSLIWRNTLVSTSEVVAGAPERGRKLISERLLICSPITLLTVLKILLIVSTGRRTASSFWRSAAAHWSPAKKCSHLSTFSTYLL